MAINRSSKDDKKSLPAKLTDLLLKGFTLQAVRDNYADAYDASRKDITGYLEHNTDGFEVNLSEGFPCDQGMVIYQSRSNWSYDKDQIIELVKTGKLTVETLISVASFNAEKLKTAIGDTPFNALATNKPTESLTLRATAEFKESVAEKMPGLVPTKAEKLEEPKAEPKKKASKKSAEDDLDAILKGVK